MDELIVVIKWFGSLSFDIQLMAGIILMALIFTRASGKKTHG